ncbi:Endospore coat-associated protein yheD [Staphylococcus petrasii]|uniref:Endospore coat-associated protein yheD n=1 Tax=Staphylococcus petrasii TaxID=1276936 RepID=A0A380FWS8_9STAP|nr:YheC/YheD family protein [Staphylococcus petrasii]PNZ24536.1 hypothetical protein CD137_12455 [Staphylococcus petrasii]TGE12097.1 hypothetical protein E2557_06345 [Staphylococcus petrasii]TGE14727.1 hypothetical protein BJR09_12660 [Staphylococcus petrasii]SUM42570.1 Endospore coat-associated protein yheD [Staphylococcus petrasii]
MKSVGMLRTSNNPLILARSVAYVCDHYQINFFYFSPEDVDIDNRKINAQIFKNGEWIRQLVEFPTVVDNEPMKSCNKEIYAALKETAILTTNPIGGKNKVFKLLKKSQLFEDVLIPYVLVKEPDDVLIYLEKYNKILLKPVFSNQGRNITAIERNGQTYKVINDYTVKEIDYKGLVKLIVQKFLSPDYICQPFIESKTKDGSPFDIRLHVRKNEKGKWQKVKIYPRIGMGKNITSNISQGGSIAPNISFLKSNFGNEWKEVKNKLEILCQSFPKRFESLYSYDLDALGIDLGIDLKGNIGLFEVNTYPGQQFFYLEDSEMRVAYYRYLLDLKNEE